MAGTVPGGLIGPGRTACYPGSGVDEGLAVDEEARPLAEKKPRLGEQPDGLAESADDLCQK